MFESVPVTLGGSCASALAEKPNTKNTKDTKLPLGLPKVAFVIFVPFVFEIVSP